MALSTYVTILSSVNIYFPNHLFNNSPYYCLISEMMEERTEANPLSLS